MACGICGQTIMNIPIAMSEEQTKIYPAEWPEIQPRKITANGKTTTRDGASQR